MIRSLPARSAFGLPGYVAASPTAPFSTALRSLGQDTLGWSANTSSDSDPTAGSRNLICIIRDIRAIHGSELGCPGFKKL
ncbi:MAG: hypothetical protein DME48_03980 [Verrucomicrobia bacterium]|nr:MAG: hypothetical protein DME48_03980 [Verrucomicrobiota bacterium]